MKHNFKKGKLRKPLLFNHDEFFREVFCNPSLAQEIFQYVFSKKERKLFNWLTLKEEKSVFGKHERADLVFSIQFHKENNKEFKILLLLLLEHKSRYDSQLLYQLLRYQTHIYKNLKKRVCVLPILFYHGKKPWNAPLSFQEKIWEEAGSQKFKDLLGKYVLDYRVKIFDTNKVLREKRKVKNYKSLIALEVLDRVWDLSAKTKDLIEIIKKIRNVKEKEERKRLMICTALYLLKYVKGLKEEDLLKAENKIGIKTQVLKRGLRMKGWEEFKEMNQRIGHAKGLKVGLTKGMKRGRSQGLEEGMEKGKEQIVISLLKENSGAEFISKITGLSKAKIMKLSRKLKKLNRG